MSKSPPNKIQYTIGQLIGEFIYLGDDHTGERWRRYGKFKCHCGNEFISDIQKIKTGHTKSCGCIYEKHGKAGTYEYKIWVSIINRCENEKATKFENWGGRGIKICPEWRSSFSTFLADMGPAPSKSHQLDREDNDGNYCKMNCRWATKIEQANNKRNNLYITYKGETKSLSDWARELNFYYEPVRKRIQDRGWDFEKAYTAPIESISLDIEYKGEIKSLREWCKILGLNYAAVITRINKLGWDIIKALETPIKKYNARSI